MKQFSKFSSLMRILAMVLTIVLVAGMVGTNKADADDNSSNVIEDLSSKIQIKKQPVNYTYLNKGSEGQDFAPVFSFDVEVPKLSSPYHYAFCQWQIKQAGAANWTDIVWDKETEEDKAHSHEGYDNNDTAMRHKLKFTETFAITGDRLRDARGSEYRCVIRLYSFNPSETDYYENLVGTVVTDSVKVDYQCQVTLLNKDSNHGTHSELAKVNVPYKTKLDLTDAISGKIVTSVEERLGPGRYAAFDLNTPIASGKTLYVKTSDAVTVTFKLGEGHGEDIVKKIAKGTTVAEPEIPEQNGYVVTSWYTTNPNNPYNFNDRVNSNLTLNAVWEKTGIEITTQPTNYKFVNQGGEAGFLPKFTFTAKITNIKKEYNYYLVYKWEEKYENDTDWVVSKITQGGVKKNSDKIYNNWNSNTITVSLPLSTDGVEGGVDVARKGKQFRCTVMIVKHTNSGDTVIAASEPTNVVRCIYTSAVNFYSKSNNNTLIATEYIGYGQAVGIPDKLKEAGKTVVLYTKDDENKYTEIQDPSNYLITSAETLYVEYKDIIYTVDFNLNGHGTPKPASQTVVFGGNATKPATDPAEEGWKFEGWFTTADGNTAFDFANTEITTNTTVYAKWTEILTYDVTFTHITSQSTQTHHGLNDKVVPVKKGEKVAEPDPAPSCNYHVFLGWYSDPSLEEKYKFEFDKTDINQSITLYGKWGVKVSFKTNVAGISFSDQILAIGDTVSPLTLDSTTYRIAGVYTNSNYGSQSVYKYPEISNTNTNFTLYVKLEKIEYVTVTFKAVKGDTVENISSTQIEKGHTVTLPTAATVEGWTFQGWYIDQAGKNAFVAGTSIDKNTVLYAKYTQNSFTVSFENTRYNRIESQTVLYGNTATRPTTDPTDSNYKFVGWFTNEYGNTQFDFKTKIEKDTKIYAHWAKKAEYTVSFEMNNHGTQVASQTVKEDGKAQRPLKDPSETNYRFDGWFADKACTTQFDFDTVISKNTVIYAKWTQTHVTVTFYSEDGKETRHGYKDGVIKTITVPMNGTIPADEIPSPTCANNSRFNGYRHVFEGWYSNEKCTVSFVFTEGLDKDTPVYSKWYTEYKVTFNGNGKIDQNVSAQWVKSGEKATEPTGITAKVDTEEFIGWFANNSNTAFSFTTPITKAIELKARTQVAEKTYKLKDGGVTKNYRVDDKLDVDNLYIVVTQGSAVTEVPVTANMVSGFDSSKAYDKLTLTVSYDNHTFTYDVVVGRKDGEISVDVEAIELVYGEQITQTNLGVDSHGDTVVITSNNPAVTIVDGKIVAAGVGEATLTLTAPQTDTHEAASTDVTVKVTAKEIAVVWSNVGPFTYNYGDAFRPVAAIKEGALVGGDTVDVYVRISTEIYQNTSAGIPGNYKATAYLKNDNYVISEETESIDFVVNAKKVSALAFSFDKLVCGTMYYSPVYVSIAHDNAHDNLSDIIIVPVEDDPNNINIHVESPSEDIRPIIVPVNSNVNRVSTLRRLLTEVTVPEVVVAAPVEVTPVTPAVAAWPNVKHNYGQMDLILRETKVYEASLEEIVALDKAGASMPAVFSGKVKGGTKYVLEQNVTVNPYLELPEQGTITATIDGKEANLYYVNKGAGSGIGYGINYVVYVEFTAEHIPGEEHEENRVEPKCLVDGSVDMVVRCTACEKVLSSEAKVLDKTGHDWGEWKIVEDADYTKPGKMVRVCKNDSEHKEEKEIPQLTNEIVKMQIVIPDTVKKEYKIGEKLNIDGLKIEFTWKDGSKTEIPVTADMVTGFNSMKATDALKLTVTYKDADGAYTIKVTKDKNIFYTITGSLVWVRGTNMNPIVHRNIDDWMTFSLFKGFKIGGKIPPANAYLAKSGSLDLTIMNEYLETLEPGEYDLTIEFEDGEVSAKITVPEATKNGEEKPTEPKKDDNPESPKTADTAQTFVWTILLAIAVTAMIAVVVYRRRREDAE